MLVYATRRGVNGFTLDQSIGDYPQPPGYQCPETGKIYSVNHGNFFQYDERSLYQCVCQRKDKSTGGPYTQRHIGSMVCDAPQPDDQGGIFMYPAPQISPKGKLRLMYECNHLRSLWKNGGR